MIKSDGQLFPPFVGNSWTCRSLCCWPPPQLLSHWLQSAHIEMRQSTISAPHDCANSIGPSQPAPPLAAGIMTSRTLLRTCFELQSDHMCQSSKTQSVGGCSGHSLCSHALISCILPVHGVIPGELLLRNPRVLYVVPLPHVCSQGSHSDHDVKSHGPGSASGLHVAVTSKSVGHAVPLLRGLWMIPRLRNLCSLAEHVVHLDHSDHSETTQSTGFMSVQSVIFLSVSTRGPLHCLPHSLATTFITRCRSRSPRQVGSCHSLHSPNSQFCGTQSGLQESFTGQTSFDCCVPLQTPSPAIWAKKKSPFFGFADFSRQMAGMSDGQLCAISSFASKHSNPELRWQLKWQGM
mmetsp:Transcript_120827/g.341651  ORF Transcript_120827/g.341651 Transcript_120827/m.341651 type:complete len:349 (-) Transcript_120827:894-1940(-)